MATETVPSDHSTTTPEQVEEEVHEEVQTIEQHTSPAKSGEEDQLKAGETPSSAAPLVKPEEKIKDKEVDPPKTEEVKETEEGEKPKAEDAPSLEVPSAESEEKTKDKEIEPPAVEEVKKTDEEQGQEADDSTSQSVPLSESAKETEDKKTEAVVVEEVNKTDNNFVEDVPVEETKGAGEDPAPQPPSVSEPEVQPLIETAEEQPKEKSTIESTKQKAEEQPKLVEVPESSVEAVGGQEEQVDESIVKEAEVPAKDDVEESEAGVKKEETVEAIPVLQEKPQEQSEVTEPVETESATVKLKESLDSKIGVDEATLADMVKDGKPWEVEEPAKAVPLVPVSSDQIASTEQAELDTIAKKPIVEALEVKGKELNGSNAGDTVSKEKVVEPGKVEADNEIKDVKSEGEKKVVIEESNEPETKIGETVNSSTSTREVTEKPLEAEFTSRDIEFIAENGKETIKDGFAAIETTKDEIVRNVDKVTTAATHEPKESEVTMGFEETLQTGEEKPDKPDENVKPDVPNTESKNGDGTKTSQDPPKEETQAKATQKHSNNILSKVKQSLVKAKKAIIGKSQNSKSAF